MSDYYDAFISYGRADSKAFAIKLHQNLTQKNLKIWFDQNDIPPAVDFQKQIEDGIQKTHNFLFIIAPHSVKSPYCLMEIELAIKFNKRIIPILYIEPTDNFDQIHKTIRSLNWIFCTEKEQKFKLGFEKIIQTILCHADYVKQHTAYLLKALRWQKNQRKTDCLLIGQERVKAESWLKIRFENEQPPCIPTDLHCEYICESIKNANNLLTQVFISHSEKDQQIKEEIDKYLRREGITIWTNKSDIKTGTEFQTEINKGIEGADNFIYLISPDSVHSKYCQEELKHALANKKRIIPILIKPTNIEEFPPSLKYIEFIDLSVDKNLKLSHKLSQLLKILDKDAYYYQQHKSVLVKSLKWQRQNRNPSILLRGYQLQYYQTWLKVALHREDNPPLLVQKEFISASASQPTESSLEVFISYSRADSDFARQLNDSLQELGKTTWFDQESIPPGADFQEEIHKGIECCNNFVFIISPASINSPYCYEEIEYAKSFQKRFIPILYRKTSSKKLHPELARVQWIDFNNYNGDFYYNFNELIRILDTDRDHVKYHTRWSQKALEWREIGKDKDLLLWGTELSLAQKWLDESIEQNKQPLPTELHKEYIKEGQLHYARQIKAEEERKERELDIIKKALINEKKAFEQERKALQVARSKNRILGILAFLMLGLTSLTILFWRKAMQESLNSQLNALSSSAGVLLASQKEFDALIESIRGGRQIQQSSGVKYDTKMNVLATLEKTLELVREKNRLQGHNYSVNSVTFSPNGEIIASASDDGTIKIWNPDGSVLQTLESEEVEVNQVAFHPDSQVIASGNKNGTIKLWNIDGTLLKSISAHELPINSISFSHDGNLIASASDDKTIKLWDINGNLVKTFTGHSKEVSSVNFSPDDKQLVSGSWDYTIKLWNLDGTLAKTFEGHKSNVNSVDFSPDGKELISGSWDYTIKLWNLDGTLLNTLKEHEGNVNQVQFSPNGELIASASHDNAVRIWDRNGILKKTLWGHSDFVKSVNFSPDGKTLASASTDNTIKLWSIHQRKRETLTLENDSSDFSTLQSVAFSPNNQTIAVADSNNNIQLWDVKGELLKSFTGHQEYVSLIKFSPDSQMIATASYDKTVKLWNINGELLATLTGHEKEVNTVDFSHNGKMVVTGSNDNTIKLWNINGELLKTFTGHSRNVSSVQFSPNDETILSGSWDHSIKLWNLEGEIILDIPTAHTDAILTTIFSPDGKMIVSSSRDSTIKLWQLNGKLLNTLAGYRSWVNLITFSQNSTIFATGSVNGNVRLWSLKHQHIETFEGNNDSILALNFSEDGKTLLSVNNNKVLEKWNFDLNYQLNLGCEWVGDYLRTNLNVSQSDRQLCHDVNDRNIF